MDESDGDGFSSCETDSTRTSSNSFLPQEQIAELDKIQALHQGHVAFHLVAAVEDLRIGLGKGFDRGRVDLNHPDLVRDVFTPDEVARISSFTGGLSENRPSQ